MDFIEVEEFKMQEWSTHEFSFTNKGTTYTIYQNSGYEDETKESYYHNAGILVNVNGKKTDLKANMKTLSGGLENLLRNDNIKNDFFE